MSELQYITDTNGQRTAVILPIEEYHAFLANMQVFGDEVEDLELLRAMEEAMDSPKVSRERVFEMLERRT